LQINGISRYKYADQDVPNHVYWVYFNNNINQLDLPTICTDFCDIMFIKNFEQISNDLVRPPLFSTFTLIVKL
jgi:hypothetical protein